jgi:hypothetical protein
VRVDEFYGGRPPVHAPVLTYPAWLERERRAERRRCALRLLGTVAVAAMLVVLMCVAWP